MESILYTNSNEIHTILSQHGVNVLGTDLSTQWEIQDIVIFDENLIPPGSPDDIHFTERELEKLRPGWKWLLHRIKDQACRPEYQHQCTLFFSGTRHYDVMYDKDKARFDFDKAWATPEHFRQRDVLYTTDFLRHASKQVILDLLKIPRMAQEIQQELYCDVKLGCPLSFYELQNSVVHAFKELLRNQQEAMEH